MADITRQRAETLNAIALLCGKAPSSFDLPEGHGIPSPPSVPPGLPSSLLERRPDIARAERFLAAKNAQIGVARAAYFPALHLTGQAGISERRLEHLFSEDSLVWSIGPSISWSLFKWGTDRRRGQKAEASYQEALAVYQQTVLTAFKEVEDSLAQIVLRNEQFIAQSEALASVSRVAELARARYAVGTVNYLEVVDAERNRLQQERQKSSSKANVSLPPFGWLRPWGADGKKKFTPSNLLNPSLHLRKRRLPGGNS